MYKKYLQTIVQILSQTFLTPSKSKINSVKNSDLMKKYSAHILRMKKHLTHVSCKVYFDLIWAREKRRTKCYIYSSAI